MTEQKFIWKDTELIIRDKTIKPYRIWSYRFDDKWDKFIRATLPEDLLKFREEIDKKTVNMLKKKFSSKQIDEQMEKHLEQNDEDTLKAIFLNKEIQKAKELFILLDNNASEMCENIFTNSNIIIHDEERTEEEMDDYIMLMVDILSFFLKRHRK